MARAFRSISNGGGKGLATEASRSVHAALSAQPGLVARLERRSPKVANGCSSRPHRLEKPRPRADPETPCCVRRPGDRRSQQAASRIGRKPATAVEDDRRASKSVGQATKTSCGAGSMVRNSRAVPEAPVGKRSAGVGSALCPCPGALAASTLGACSLALD